MNSANSPVTQPGLFAEAVHLQQAGRRGALATPLWFSGSVPLRNQSRLLLCDDGRFVGTIGGGLLEAQVLQAARAVLAGDEARVMEFDLAGDEAARRGMICGGRCAVLIVPIMPGRDEAAYAAAAQAEAAGARAVLIARLDSGRVLTFTEAGDLVGTSGDAVADVALREAAQEALAAEVPRTVEAPVRAHLDVLAPRPTAYVFGGGHIGVVVAHLATLVGFRVVVADDRGEFANRERFPQADEVLVQSVPDVFTHRPVAANSYIVAVTRGHAQDEEVMIGALRSPARYIGMIGSKRKVAGVLARLRAQGFTEEDLARVHAPIGLAIGADTVEEIAVSIVAELIAVRRGAA